MKLSRRCNCRWQQAGPVFVIINRLRYKQSTTWLEFCKDELDNGLGPGRENCIWITSPRRKEGVLGEASPNLNKNDHSWVSKEPRIAGFSKLSGQFYQAPEAHAILLSAKIRKNGPQICYLSCLKSAISDKGLHVNRFLISTVMWARFSHASLGSWGVVDQLAQVAFLPYSGLTTVEVGTVSRWRGVPPW